jgi:hypothetical protein
MGPLPLPRVAAVRSIIVLGLRLPVCPLLILKICFSLLTAVLKGLCACTAQDKGGESVWWP